MRRVDFFFMITKECNLTGSEVLSVGSVVECRTCCFVGGALVKDGINQRQSRGQRKDRLKQNTRMTAEKFKNDKKE